MTIDTYDLQLYKRTYLRLRAEEIFIFITVMFVLFTLFLLFEMKRRNGQK